ncbi:ECM21 [Candida jiufengensis]|uniref:ECM21 n=1 Tax=Candida jiufengensis TaxID=497108 RepID=UPI00222590E9|nr:ECM21 [Candida jiufengensis]KAI5951189.1 ECM21 [Candida jiufengensis]
MHHPRSFSFDKLKNKVVHRHSTDSNLEIHNRSHSLDNSTNSSPNNKNNSQSNHHSYFHKSDTPPRENLSTSSRIRSTSLSFHHDSPKERSRSRTRSKSITHHSQTLSPSNIFKSNKTKDLIKQETSNVLSKKLIQMLQDLGLQQPISLKTTTSGSISKTCKIYISNSNDCIYLPPAASTSFTYEDVENGGTVPNNDMNSPRSSIYNQQENDDQFPADLSRRSSTSTPSTLNETTTSNSIYQRMKSFHSPNYLCSKIDSDLPIPHTFAVIIELTKDVSTIKDLVFKFQSSTQILWPTGDPYNRSQLKEKFRIGTMEWSTNFNNADYYINASNSSEYKFKNIKPDDLAKRSREYKLVDISKTTNNNPRDEFSTEDSPPPSSTSTTEESSTPQFNSEHKAGLYVFLLPILLPEHIPATIVSINGTLSHTLSVNFNKISDKLNRKLKVNAAYAIPMVRTPPNFANSIADKPIYVNRVWNDSVHYMITFPKKYISLGSEHVINVKLVPLVKDVVLKRIKFNVLERITYVCKDLSKEYDYDSEDPNFLHPLSKENKIRERVVSLCELKTKHKQSSNAFGDPYKEEVIKCPDNNLLFSCYEPENEFDNTPASKKKNHQKDKTMIASPIDINIALPFLTTKTDKYMMTGSSSEDEYSPFSSTNTPTTSRKASIIESTTRNPPSSPIIGSLETNLSNVDEVGLHESQKHPTSAYLSDDLSSKHTPPENIKNGYTLVSRALYPDSNFRHIQINHRLQICFRISKPDPKDDFKMHHYEVVVDTPLILLSSKCNDVSIQLPRYNEIEVLNSVTSEDSISFNTPNYKSTNGVSIKPWIPNSEENLSTSSSTEQLPSFEEATSTPNSPLTRSLSYPEDPLSRIPSIPLILPNEPAPAYEDQEDQFTSVSPTPTPPSTSAMNTTRDSVSSLNIDEIVTEEITQPPSATGLERRQSSIKESLSQSFRPNNSQPNSFSNNSPFHHRHNHQRNEPASSPNSSDDNRSIQSSSSSSLILNQNGTVGVTPPSSTIPDSTSSLSSISDEVETEEAAINEVNPLEFSNDYNDYDNEEAILDDDDDEEEDSNIPSNGLTAKVINESSDENLIINNYQPEFSQSANQITNDQSNISIDNQQNEKALEGEEDFEDEDDEGEEKEDEDDEEEENEDLITQEIKFAQRLPLLKNISSDSIRTTSTNYNNPTRYQNKSSASLANYARQSTDNLSLMTVSTNLTNLKPQDIHHLNT